MSCCSVPSYHSLQVYWCKQSSLSLCLDIAQLVQQKTTDREHPGSNPGNDKSVCELTKTQILPCTVKTHSVTTTCFLWLVIVHNLPLSSNTLNDSLGYNERSLCGSIAQWVELMPMDRVVPGSNPATDSDTSVHEPSKTLPLAVTVTFFSIPFYRCSQLYYDISFWPPNIQQ